MKIDEREIRQAMDRRMSALEASAERRAAIRRRVGEEEPIVRRKMTASVAFALALMLALTGAALAVGLSNLFEYFGRNDERLAVIADQATPATQQPGRVDSEKLGHSVGTIHNVYYDGQTLLVAYSMENTRRVEAYTPTEEQLKNAEKEQVAYIPEALNEEEERIIGEYAAKVKKGEPCGLAIYTVYAADHSYADGIDLGCEMTERENEGPDGVRYMLREYGTPLPEALRDRDFLTVSMTLREHITYLWFDGNATWAIRENPRETGSMTATVARTEAESMCFSGIGEYGGVEVRAKATLSAVRGELILTGTKAFPKLEEGHYDFEIYDGEGSRYRADSMSVNHPDEISISFYGNGALPEKLSVAILVEDSEGVRHEDASEAIELTFTE